MRHPLLLLLAPGIHSLARASSGGASVVERRCMIQPCEGCVSAKVHDAPGVGFALGFSYGTSAVNFFNRTVINAVKVEASSEYRNLLQRLSKIPKPVKPGWWERLRRRLNRAIGKPSTPDVAVLSSLISHLRDATLSKLPLQRIDKIAVSMPLMPGILAEDLVDAVEYAGMESWLPTSTSSNMIGENRAVLLGNGEKICQNHSMPGQCICEEDWMPRDLVYTISFTYQEIYSALDSIFSPFRVYNTDERSVVDFNLGLQNLTTSPSPAIVWDKVKQHIKILPLERKQPVTKLYLSGEAAMHPGFRRAVRDAMGEVTLSSGAEELSVAKVQDPVFAAARGAAYYARRRHERVIGCVESSRCEEQRKKERNGDDARGSQVELR